MGAGVWRLPGRTAGDGLRENIRQRSNPEMDAKIDRIL